MERIKADFFSELESGGPEGTGRMWFLGLKLD